MLFLGHCVVAFYGLLFHYGETGNQCFSCCFALR
uniref:Uncharacterized protein n=1 Tax=Anguilla anguilla TaxID=7936 RepID=A0A0E9PV80_ANGAN